MSVCPLQTNTKTATVHGGLSVNLNHLNQLYKIHFQMVGTFSSAMAGPMAGAFLVGMFIPWINVKVDINYHVFTFYIW